jgi:hypothetical protein
MALSVHVLEGVTAAPYISVAFAINVDKAGQGNDIGERLFWLVWGQHV